MHKKKIFFLALVMLLSVLAGCDDTATPSDVGDSATVVVTEQKNSEEATADPTTENVENASDEDVWPDVYPQIPVIATDETYAYDDMSVHYEIDMLVIAYINTKLEPDPVEALIEELFNIDITYTNMAGGDLETAMMTRFSSGDAPDFVKLYNKTQAMQLFNEGMTMNAEIILEYMPTVKQYITKNFKVYTTDPVTGEMFATTKLGDADTWGYFYRSDWLETFGMDEPVTRAELIEYAQKCTFDDPDGNGEDDTWFMGAAGAGDNLGMLMDFQSMFGHPDFNVADGRINHPMIDGTTKEYLLFLKELYDLGALAPDFYTVDWESFKSYTMNDKIGMVRYPGDQLVTEYLNAQDNDLASITVWQPLSKAPFADGATEGKYGPGSSPDGLFIYNADLLEDKGKMLRLAHLVDWWTYPNEGFFDTQHGGSPENYEDWAEYYPQEGEYSIGYEPDTGLYYWDTSTMTECPTDAGGFALHDWQALSLQRYYKKYTNEDYGARQNANIAAVKAIPRWNNYGLLLSLDPDAKLAIDDYREENEILFMIGQRSMDEWDVYVEEWLERGGDELLDEAAGQLGVEH